MSGEYNEYDEKECVALFHQLFPRGLAGQDVIEELAPQGWQAWPLAAVFHPSPEQVYQETLDLRRNLSALTKKPPDEPEPTLAGVTQTFCPTSFDVPREVRDLVGMCLWDIFSDNHDVVAPDGRLVHLGSFRGSGGFIADFAGLESEQSYDYIDFYMGTIWVARRADLTPVYAMIFRRLKQADLDWRYHFPRLYLIDMKPLHEALKKKDEPEWAGYSPEESFAKEQQDAEREHEINAFREDLDHDYRDAVAAAQNHPPPKTVVAYQQVYGRLPEGWPPV